MGRYPNPPNEGLEMSLLLAEYFEYYNKERRYESIAYHRPMDMFGKVASINRDMYKGYPTY